MGYVDFILNLAGLLLWLNWRSIRFDPLTKRLPATLMGTLRPAAPKKLRRWHLLAFLVAMLMLRAVIYWWLGSPVWSGKLDLGVTVLAFRNDWFLRILFFSFFSFGVTLGVFYVGLLLLSLLQGPETIHSLIKIPLGRVDDWPRWARVFLPLVVTMICWLLAGWLLVWLQVLPPPVSMAQRLEQALIIGMGCYLIWKIPAGVVLTLYLLNSYIYFGPHPFWKYIGVIARKILRPLQPLPLRLGRADFTPLLGIAIIFLVAEGGARGLAWLYNKTPF